MADEQTVESIAMHPDATTDEELLGVLDGIIGADADGDETPLVEEKEEKPTKTGRERGPDGKFKPKEEEKTETPVSEETEPEATKQEPPQPAVPERANPVEYATAIQALHRDGVPPSVIEAMDPTEMISWGLKRDVVQKENDGLKRQITELEKRPEVPAEAPAAPSMNLDEGIKPFVEQYGEEAAEPLKAFGEALAQQIYEQAHAEVSEKTSKLDAIEQRLLNQEREAARDGLKKQYKVEQADRWQQVLSRREQDTFPYSSESDALRASCQVLFSDELLAEAQVKKTETNQARSNGQPTTATKGSPPPERLTFEQKCAKNEREILEAILDDDDDRKKALAKEGEKLRMSHAMQF